METYDAIIVGGGFFGCSLGLHLGTRGKKVLILEKEADLMTRASYNNQARVHGGYHYSRSLLTALRSRVSFADFVAEYEDCIDSSFGKYYAIARTFSKVSAKHFFLFCKRIGADINKAPDHIQRYFDHNLIEEVYTVREYAFDSLRLREHMRRDLVAAGVEYRLHTEALSLTREPNHMLTLHAKDVRTGESHLLRAKEIFNCAYAHINKLNSSSGLPLIPLKHELTELALVEVPDELAHTGITVMDGPFFSIMPFPSRGLHTLSHVRYTPHVAWHDQQSDWRDGHNYLAHNQPPSAYPKMVADAKRYVPLVGKAKHVGSLWEIKTILPQSEHSDSRPILFVPNHGGVPGYTCIMGGKIDNIQDILGEVDILHGG